MRVLGFKRASAMSLWRPLWGPMHWTDAFLPCHISTEPLLLILSGNHHEWLQFHFISLPHITLVLDHPWLQQHNPHNVWLTGKIISCHSSFSLLGAIFFFVAKKDESLHHCMAFQGLNTISIKSPCSALHSIPFMGPQSPPNWTYIMLKSGYRRAMSGRPLSTPQATLSTL